MDAPAKNPALHMRNLSAAPACHATPDALASGASRRALRWCKAVVMVVLFAIFVVAIRMYTFDPKEASEQEMIMACRDALNDTANGIETRQTLREACDSWEQKFREKYGHGPY